eukprot:CAMPEP_0181235460 /NCGR_PEP_ID=MMETSP1096-20121128/37586_1 /TAXON_ID=156174 ORGANISM="Chrysochromulina ericina, Strain CCMP281" /NCGR_SAMPLE_ID=MMETSP1096 /ASSEMBLY_ACC=CAM_ASM_000453 /LENGTH=102 /DNA_ID=CAMNT_0023330439 /DNA_START=261 /DNA_END=569 /DNA_ORIENTATION=-
MLKGYSTCERALSCVVTHLVSAASHCLIQQLQLHAPLQLTAQMASSPLALRRLTPLSAAAVLSPSVEAALAAPLAGSRTLISCCTYASRLLRYASSLSNRAN